MLKKISLLILALGTFAAVSCHNDDAPEPSVEKVSVSDCFAFLTYADRTTVHTSVAYDLTLIPTEKKVDVTFKGISVNGYSSSEMVFKGMPYFIDADGAIVIEADYWIALKDVKPGSQSPVLRKFRFYYLDKDDKTDVDGDSGSRVLAASYFLGDYSVLSALTTTYLQGNVTCRELGEVLFKEKNCLFQVNIASSRGILEIVLHNAGFLGDNPVDITLGNLSVYPKDDALVLSKTDVVPLFDGVPRSSYKLTGVQGKFSPLFGLEMRFACTPPGRHYCAFEVDASAK